MRPKITLLFSFFDADTSHALWILNLARMLAILLLLGLCVLSLVFPDYLAIPLMPSLQTLVFLLTFLLLQWLFHTRFSARFWLHAGMMVDVIALTEWLMFTGGISNPLTFLYLWPVLAAALLCQARFAWVVTLMTVAAYLLLFFYHWPLPIFSESPENLLRIHFFGMWLTFAIAAMLMTGWISRLSASVRERDRRLLAAHRKQQEDEAWMILGVEAASIAHQLSTPLNNLLLLNDEMHAALTSDSPLMADVTLARAQLNQCRDILQTLKTKNRATVKNVALYEEMQARLKDWHNLRPDVDYRWHRHPQDQNDYHVALHETFWSAFFNILNNAADAGSGRIDIYTRVLPGAWWQIGIHNRYGLLTEAQLNRAGLDLFESGKDAGLGLGVPLSHATLSRLSGSLTLSNHREGGVYAQITLPLDTTVGRCDDPSPMK